MRKFAVALLLLGASLTTVVALGRAPRVTRVSAGRGIDVSLPHGWHLLRRGVAAYPGNLRISSQPAVMASFAVGFARHPCQCARPNYRTCGAWCKETAIRDFPQAGALVYVWESPRSSAHPGRGYARRPVRFRVGQRNPHFADVLAHELRGLHLRAGHACVEGPGSLPSWWSDFRDAGRVFQVEVYLGPAAGTAVRAHVDALLDSLEVARLRPASPAA